MTAQITMTPQVYPLWCVSIDETDNMASVGRILGWIDADGDANGRWHQPVVAFTDHHGRASRINTPLDEEELFFGETRAEAWVLAEEWVNRERMFRMELGPGSTWDRDRDLPSAVDRAARDGLTISGDPETDQIRVQGQTVTMLTWPKARPRTRLRILPDGAIADDRPTR